jgi:hypothetical protein
MKCLLCNQKFDEKKPLDHFAMEHNMSGSQKSMLQFILALQKKIEERKDR